MKVTVASSKVIRTTFMYLIYSRQWRLARADEGGACQLRIDMEDFENVTKFAVYGNFRVGDSQTGYRLTISGYNGTAGDDFLILLTRVKILIETLMKIAFLFDLK